MVSDSADPLLPRLLPPRLETALGGAVTRENTAAEPTRFDSLQLHFGQIADHVMGCINSIRLPNGSYAYTRSYPSSGSIFGDAMAGRGDSLCEPTDVIDDEGGVGLGRRVERRVDAEMHLEIAVLEPAATAPREVWRLRDVTDSKQAFVERDCHLFCAHGHRQLDVVQSNHSHSSMMSRQANRVPPTGVPIDGSACTATGGNRPERALRAA